LKTMDLGDNIARGNGGQRDSYKQAQDSPSGRLRLRRVLDGSLPLVAHIRISLKLFFSSSCS
jgi:hypothetical protein